MSFGSLRWQLCPCTSSTLPQIKETGVVREAQASKPDNIGFGTGDTLPCGRGGNPVPRHFSDQLGRKRRTDSFQQRSYRFHGNPRLSHCAIYNNFSLRGSTFSTRHRSDKFSFLNKSLRDLERPRGTGPVTATSSRLCPGPLHCDVMNVPPLLNGGVDHRI